MAVSTRIGALAAYGGALLGCLLSLGLGAPTVDVGAGLWGYNSSLTAVAMLTFFVPSGRACIVTVAAIFATVLFDGALRAACAPLGAPIGTLPFCFASVLFVLTQSKVPGFNAVPIAAVATPEEHLWSARVHMHDAADQELGPPKAESVTGATKEALRVSTTTTTDTEAVDPRRLSLREVVVLTPPSSRDASKHDGSVWLEAALSAAIEKFNTSPLRSSLSRGGSREGTWHGKDPAFPSFVGCCASPLNGSPLKLGSRILASNQEQTTPTEPTLESSMREESETESEPAPSAAPMSTAMRAFQSPTRVGAP
jgi:hypothetical protein